MGTMERVITEIRQDLRTLPGIRPLLDIVPDSVNAYPALVIYPMSMSWKLGSHSGDRGKRMRIGLFTIGIHLLVSRDDLERNVAALMEFCDTLPDFLFAGFARDAYGGAAVTLGNPAMAQNATWPIRVVMGESGWGDAKSLAWRMELDISVNEEINV